MCQLRARSSRCHLRRRCHPFLTQTFWVPPYRTRQSCHHNFARHYAGTLLLRFDDTNPSNEKQEGQDSILDDLKWMNVNPDRISYTGDYFQQLYYKAVELIRLGKAYADDAPKEEVCLVHNYMCLFSLTRDRCKRSERPDSSHPNIARCQRRRLSLALTRWPPVPKRPNGGVCVLIDSGAVPMERRVNRPNRR